MSPLLQKIGEKYNRRRTYDSYILLFTGKTKREFAEARRYRRHYQEFGKKMDKQTHISNGIFLYGGPKLRERNLAPAFLYTLQIMYHIS